MKYKKVIRNNQVALLISSGKGGGWYTWNDYIKDYEQLIFSPKVVEMVEQNRTNEINETWVKDNLELEGVYCGGIDGLTIKWLPIGTHFKIIDYEGKEELLTLESLTLVT